MAKKKKKTKKYSISLVPLIAVSIVFAFIILVTVNDKLKISYIPTWSEIAQKTENAVSACISYITDLSNNSSEDVAGKPFSVGELEVHIIDVGQGDSILIKNSNKTVLIDAGENDKGKTVVDYLKSQNVKNIDILIGTHPHSDHIGGMDYVIENMNVNKIIMPKLPDELIPTTRTYTDVLQAVASKGLKITAAKPSLQYDLGGGATLKIIAPIDEFKSLNEMSVVTRLDYGESSFLFTGDIEKYSEKSIVASNINIDVDVLDVPHHGSKGSSSNEFLSKITPKFAVISCGENNDYGHPHKEAVERIGEYCEINRTDLSGNILIKSDGKTITVIPQKGEEYSFDAK